MILRVADSSQVSRARRAISDRSRDLGLDEATSGRAALVATEMATNLLKHAGSGEIVVDRFGHDSGCAGLDILSLDKGGGITDLSRALEDGFSTAGSAGTGLGAIRRQADEFAIFSRPGIGTAILARLYLKAGTQPSGDAVIGAVVEPYPGETECGDAWAYAKSPVGSTLLCVDGSGHGVHAARAAQAAVAAFHANQQYDCVRIVEAIHRALTPTRGAAVAVARIDARTRIVHFVGVGNIAAAVIAGGTMRRMVSHNGTAGHVAPRIREFTYPYDGDPTVILHSDGLTSKWDIAAYPGLTTSHPSLIAGVLFRDHRRGRDDASIVAMRLPAAAVSAAGGSP